MFEIDFYTNGQRKTIPLGAKYTEKTAKDLKEIVETLLQHKDNSVTILDKRTSVWIESATQEIREKLAKAGLNSHLPTHSKSCVRRIANRKRVLCNQRLRFTTMPNIDSFPFLTGTLI